MHMQFGFNRNLVWYFLLALLLHLTLPAVLSGSEPTQIAKEEFEKKGKYELSVKDNLVSLHAEDAFLKEILEDIGQRMNIEVFARRDIEKLCNDQRVRRFQSFERQARKRLMVLHAAPSVDAQSG